MATHIKRPALFQRRYSRLLKPVESLGPKVREDEDGFDDLEDYFGQEFENEPKEMNSNLAARLNGLKIAPITEDEPGYVFSQPVPQEYTVPLKGDSEEEEEVEEQNENFHEDNMEDDYTPMMDDDYGYDQPEETGRNLSEDEEINFSPNITLHRPAAPVSPSPKATAVAKVPKKRAAPRTRVTPLPVIDNDNDDGSGLRHGRRNRIKPLEFWRGETVKYKVDSNLKIPVVAEVVRRDRTPVKPRTRPTQKAAAAKRKAATSKAKKQEQLEEAGFVPQVNVSASVMDYDTHKPTERLLAVSADQHNPVQVPGEQFSISTVFEEGAFLTAGLLVFPAGVEKPSRNSSKHALVFYVIQGVFQVTINESTFVIGTGGHFIVPRGNHYALKSLYDGESKLHFCHCKDSAAL